MTELRDIGHVSLIFSTETFQGRVDGFKLRLQFRNGGLVVLLSLGSFLQETLLMVYSCLVMSSQVYVVLGQCLKTVTVIVNS